MADYANVRKVTPKNDVGEPARAPGDIIIDLNNPWNILTPPDSTPPDIPPNTGGPTKSDCSRAGCDQYYGTCPDTGSDPWIYAFVGSLIGIGIGAGIAHAFGKKKR